MSKLRELENVNDLSGARLWKALDTISDRLTSIEKQLSEVVRLEERVNNHEQALSRYGNRLDGHDRRLHETELWQASYGDKSSVERMITNVQVELTTIEKKVEDLELSKNVTKGQRDVGKEILKWVVAILSAILIYKITGD